MTELERGGRDAAGESTPTLERFLGEPTRRLDDWRWLWAGDVEFPVRSHRGVFGHLVVAFKRLLRPFVKTPQNDLWERQRIFNLILLEYLQRGEDLRALVTDVHARRLDWLEAVYRQGLDEVIQHNDALFARADQKLDFLRRETRQVWARLGGAIARAEAGGPVALAQAHQEQVYVELERRFRGTEEDIAARIARYLPQLADRGEILDLGCGRGEALEVLTRQGIPARGIDFSSSMVEECRKKGLRAEVGDLFAVLAALPENELGGIVSFHVIEHLPAERLDALVRLAWRTLRPGGVLLLETPNPLSLVVAARNFWLDPTHRRPIHPESLRLSYELAGFDPVDRIDLRPFDATERLPEIESEKLPEDQRALAYQVNLLRDRLDDLLFGYQDYALVGIKPRP
ncbi:MAG: class I SAM-dependent methyltransferase [Thermoanaerobaculia bacterium]